MFERAKRWWLLDEPLEKMSEEEAAKRLHPAHTTEGVIRRNVEASTQKPPIKEEPT